MAEYSKPGSCYIVWEKCLEYRVENLACGRGPSMRWTSARLRAWSIDLEGAAPLEMTLDGSHA